MGTPAAKQASPSRQDAGKGTLVISGENFHILVLTNKVVNDTIILTIIVVKMTWKIYKREGDGRMPLQNRVKELRARIGVNQQELGSLVGASRQTISLIERGDYHPSVLLALRIAQVFHVPLEEVFFITGEEDNHETND